MVVLELWNPCLPRSTSSVHDSRHEQQWISLFLYEILHHQRWAYRFHEQNVLASCLVLQLYLQQVALLCHEPAQHWDSCCLQMNVFELPLLQQVALFYLKNWAHLFKNEHWSLQKKDVFLSSRMSLCKYCAWRGIFKSISSRSLWLLSLGSTSKKNTVCLLLELWPPSVNPELMIECKLNPHPIWYWKNPLGITTLSCNEGSIRLRPECLWRARK